MKKSVTLDFRMYARDYDSNKPIKDFIVTFGDSITWSSVEDATHTIFDNPLLHWDLLAHLVLGKNGYSEYCDSLLQPRSEHYAIAKKLGDVYAKRPVPWYFVLPFTHLGKYLEKQWRNYVAIDNRLKEDLRHTTAEAMAKAFFNA